MVSLPKRFRKNIFIVPQSYVVIEPIAEGNKLRGEIVRVLADKQIKHFASVGVWPELFKDCTCLNVIEFNVNRHEEAIARGNKHLTCSSSTKSLQQDEYESPDSSDDDDDIEPNFNRKAISSFKDIYEADSGKDSQDDSEDTDDSEDEEVTEDEEDSEDGEDCEDEEDSEDEDDRHAYYRPPSWEVVCLNYLHPSC